MLGLVGFGRSDAVCRSNSVDMAKVSDMLGALRVVNSGRKWYVLK